MDIYIYKLHICILKNYVYILKVIYYINVNYIYIYIYIYIKKIVNRPLNRPPSQAFSKRPCPFN